ncbi:MAG: hypothetical protein IT324_19620 [Anaerolineae bacterium]|nr:hypothetical protein [Anaerolineae bacterium]
MLLGIPTLVFDFYGFNFDIYDQLKGVVKVTEKALLSVSLHRMLTDQIWYEQLQHAQLNAAQRTALFDGQAYRRIIDLIGD